MITIQQQSIETQVMEGSVSEREMCKWGSILGSYHSPALLTDPDEKVHLANQPAESLWLTTSDNLQQKKLDHLVSETRDDLEWSIKKQVLRTSGYYHGMVLIRQVNQGEKLCRITIDKMNGNSGNYLIAQFAIDKSDSIRDYKDFVKIKNAINKNLGTVKDIRQLGAGMRLDYRRILYLFKKFEGLTPKQFFKQLRITKCIDLLQTERLSLKEIAYELGFCDLSHLCNSFREEMDMTLNEYKEQY